MSLIVEALKRARDDAIRRQAASKGLPLAPVPRMRSRSRWLSIALVPLVAALVVCILLLVDLYSRLPQPAVAEESPIEAAQLPAPIEASIPRTAAGEEISSASAAEVEAPDARLDSATPTASSTPAAQSPAPTPETSSNNNPTRTVADPTQLEVPQSSPRPANSPASRNAREFVGQAQLLDGQLVDLGGIAWSESEPFALLNGQVVGIGELIRAYRVVEISQDQVVLEQGEDRVVLRLK